MFALTGGEFALVAFIFALVYGARVLPQLGERLGLRLFQRRRSTGDGASVSATPDKSEARRG
jgi:Sec-independent protein translocase protein TatA